MLDKENQFSKSRADSQLAALKDRVNQLQKDNSDQEKELNVVNKMLKLMFFILFRPFS